MAHSPEEQVFESLSDYRSGWKAVFKMMKEGLSWSGRERNCAFLNMDGARFAELSSVSGLDFADDARGAAVVDWDLDGRLDLWVTNRTAPQARFMHNVSERGFAFWSKKEVPRRNHVFLREFSDGKPHPWLPTHVTHCTVGIRGYLIGAAFDPPPSADQPAP